MGNLPNSRTTTINSGDPISGNLIGEIEDCIIGAKRKLFARESFPSAWSATGTAPTLVPAPAGLTQLSVWKLPTAQTVRTRIPYEPGETLQSLTLEVYGDGGVDWTTNLYIRTDMTGASGSTIGSSGSGVTNEPAAWRFDTSTVIVPTIFPDRGVLFLEFVLSGGTQLYLSIVQLGLTR